MSRPWQTCFTTQGAPLGVCMLLVFLTKSQLFLRRKTQSCDLEIKPSSFESPIKMLPKTINQRGLTVLSFQKNEFEKCRHFCGTFYCLLVFSVGYKKCVDPLCSMSSHASPNQKKTGAPVQEPLASQKGMRNFC